MEVAVGFYEKNGYDFSHPYFIFSNTIIIGSPERYRMETDI